MVTPTTAEQLAAARALLARHRGEGPPINKTVLDAAISISAGEPLTPDRVRRLGLMRDLYEADPDVLEFLGGSHRAAIAASTTRRLRETDIALRAGILAIADMVIEETARKIDVELRNRVERSRLKPVEAQAFDMLSTSEFLGMLRPTAKARLTLDEESQVVDVVDGTAPRIEALLDDGSATVAAALNGLVDTDALVETHTADRARAVAMFTTAVSAMVLGRLDRATDNPARAMIEQALTPVGVARDILEVAGGAAASPQGGLVRENGVALAVDGTRSRGANFAQGNSVSASIEESQGLVARRVFRHSGASNARSEHAAADGSTDEELGGAIFPGQHSDCGCYWTIEWRRP